MSRNGSGVYTLNTAGQPVVTGTTITATAFNAATADIATALTQSICVDGQTTTTGLIPFAVGLKTDTLSPFTANGPVSVSAGQLAFPATQNPAAGANTLDDYEEGTYTPTDQSGAAISFSAADGFYTKIGNVVNIFGSVTYPVSVSGATATISIPFAGINSGTNGQAGVRIVAQSNANTITGFINKNASTMGFLGNALGTITNASVANGVVYFAGTYLTAT